MAYAVASQILSFASCVSKWQPRSTTMFLSKAPALSLRFHSVKCEAEKVQELDAKTLHHLRKKKERKIIRKVRKERREKRRLEEEALTPVAIPNPAMLKFDKPLEDWNRPRRKKSREPSGATDTRIWKRESAPADASKFSVQANTPEWEAFEAAYEDRLKRIERVDSEVIDDSFQGGRSNGAAGIPNSRTPTFEPRVEVSKHNRWADGTDTGGEGIERLVSVQTNESARPQYNKALVTDAQENASGQKRWMKGESLMGSTESVGIGDLKTSVRARTPHNKRSTIEIDRWVKGASEKGATKSGSMGGMEGNERGYHNSRTLETRESLREKFQWVKGTASVELSGVDESIGYSEIGDEVLEGEEGLATTSIEKQVKKFNEVGSFTREQILAARRTKFGKKVARVIIGRRKGENVYLSTKDDDAREDRGLPRTDLDEKKQLEWLSKQLNSVSTRTDGVHFSRLMRSGGLKITDGRAVTLLKLLGEQGSWRRAIEVVDWLTSRNHFPACRSRYVFTTLLAVLGKARRPTEALNAFKVMCEHAATYPDMAAYHCIAVTLGQTGCMEELLGLIETLRKGPKMPKYVLNLERNGVLAPDIVVYNAVLNACVPHKHWQCALWVLDQIKKEKLHLNSASYGLAIEVMMKAGKVDLAWKTLEKMEASGYYPNSLTYKVLVEGLGRAGKADNAVAMVKQMEQRGMVPSAGVYFALASALCMCGRWRDAVLQVEQLVKLSKKPLVETYTGFIRACEKAGLWQDAISVFQYMQEVCAPNIGTYNVMIALYGRNNMFDEAKSLFNLLKKGRLSPQKLYKNDVHLSPDMFTYDAMLGACAQSWKWEDLESTYQQMILHGFELNCERHTWILNSLSNAGKHDLVERLYSQLKSKNNAATPELNLVMVSSCVRVGKDNEAFKYLEEMVQQKMSITSVQLQRFQEVSCSLSEEDRSNFIKHLDSLQISAGFHFRTSAEPFSPKDDTVARAGKRKPWKELEMSLSTHRGREKVAPRSEAQSNSKEDSGTSSPDTIEEWSSRAASTSRDVSLHFRKSSSPTSLWSHYTNPHGNGVLLQQETTIPEGELMWRGSQDDEVQLDPLVFDEST